MSEWDWDRREILCLKTTQSNLQSIAVHWYEMQPLRDNSHHSWCVTVVNERREEKREEKATHNNTDDIISRVLRWQALVSEWVREVERTGKQTSFIVPIKCCKIPVYLKRIESCACLVHVCRCECERTFFRINRYVTECNASIASSACNFYLNQMPRRMSRPTAMG